MAQLREHTTHLAIQNQRAALSDLREGLERFCIDHGVPRKSLVELQVALDEIVSNIIKYAWPEGGTHDISVRITARSREVEVEVVDDGQAFDPRSAPAPEAPRVGRRIRPGGVGIHMTRQLIDRIDYVRANGRNHIIMKKRCAVGTPLEEE